MSKIITDNQINMLDDVEPAEILAAVHKRLVLTERGFSTLKGIVQDFSVELEMLKEKIKNLESKKVDNE